MTSRPRKMVIMSVPEAIHMAPAVVNRISG